MSSRDRRFRRGMYLSILAASIGIAGVLLLGFRWHRTIHIDLITTDPGALRPGAPVKWSGIAIGKVTALSLRRSPTPGALAQLEVELEHAEQLGLEDSWQIIYNPIFGESFVQVLPRPGERHALYDGAQITANQVSPLHQLLGSSGEDLALPAQLSSEIALFHSTMLELNALLQTSHQLIKSEAPQWVNMRQDAQSGIEQSTVLIRALNQELSSGDIRAILSSTRHLGENLEKEVPSTLARLDHQIELLGSVAAPFESAEGKQQIAQLLTDLSKSASDLRQSAKISRELLENTKNGKGTAGRLLKDELLIDDLETLVLDLKQHPWKLIWRE